MYGEIEKLFIAGERGSKAVVENNLCISVASKILTLFS